MRSGTTAIQRATDISRRTALGALTLGAVGFAAFGPRGLREQVSGRTVLDYWEKWTNVEGEAIAKVIKEFNESQSRIHVRYITTSSIDQKALVAIAGGDPPDLVGLWNWTLPSYADSGAILPLEDLAASVSMRSPTGAPDPVAGDSQKFTLDRYSAGVQPVMQHRGRWYGVVNTGGTLALYYNRQHFRDAGLDPDRPPQTIAEFDEYVRRLTVKDENGQLLRFGFVHNNPGWWPWAWPYHFGGSLYDEATNRSLADSEPVRAAYAWYENYPRTHSVAALTPFSEQFDYDSPLNKFIAGKVSMMLQGPWLANIIVAHQPDLDYAAAPFPVADGLYDPARPVGMIDTDVLVIPKGAKDPQASMEFIAYLQRQEVVEFLSSVHCKMSPLRESTPAFLDRHKNRAVRVHDALAKSDRAYYSPKTRAWPEIRLEYGNFAQGLWNGDIDLASGLARVQQRAQQTLDITADQQRRRNAISRSGGAA